MTYHCTRCGVPVSEEGRRCNDCASIRSGALGWREAGACVNEDPDLFHAPDGERGDSPAAAERIAAAKKICARCDVRAECLERAISTRDRHAIAGGTTPDERETTARHEAREVRRARKAAVS